MQLALLEDTYGLRQRTQKQSLATRQLLQGDIESLVLRLFDWIPVQGELLQDEWLGGGDGVSDDSDVDSDREATSLSRRPSKSFVSSLTRTRYASRNFRSADLSAINAGAVDIKPFLGDELLKALTSKLEAGSRTTAMRLAAAMVNLDYIECVARGAGTSGAFNSASEYRYNIRNLVMKRLVAASKQRAIAATPAGLANRLRHLVSLKKRRFVRDGFDLDLTYVTRRLIAMGFPSKTNSLEGLYRNSMTDVERFFRFYHSPGYKVYNLCSERQYDPQQCFDGNVAHWPFDLVAG